MNIKIKRMNLGHKFSIQKKLLGAMLLISIIPILLLAYFSMNITQKNMREQLMQNRVLGMGWLNDKLSTELSEFTEFFYKHEVDRQLKRGLISWGIGNPISDTVLSGIRLSFEEELNMNSNIRSIEVYNYDTGYGYAAERSSFYPTHWDAMDSLWKSRDAGLQTNLAIMRDGEDFLVIHQMNEFSTGRAIAVFVIRLNKYAFTGTIQNDIEQGENAILFNDAGILLAEVGDTPSDFAGEQLMEILQKVKAEPSGSVMRQDSFYFYESINKGKLELLYIVPDRLIRRQLNSTAKIATIILICSLAAAVVLSILFSEMISKPIIRLSKKMQKTDIHNFTTGSTIERKDEIGLLQESFDKMMYRNQMLVAQEYESELEKRKAQLSALQAQINPHFLYNTLQVIGGMSVAGRSDEIYPVITALSDILRYAIGYAQPMVTLEQEIKYLESYISIENSRFDDRLRIELDIDEDAMGAYIPKLILQPIVENCLEHGLSKKPGNWLIKLTASVDTAADCLIITVADNGLGMDEAALESLRMNLKEGQGRMLNTSSRIGLGNVHSRILIQSGPEYGVDVQSRENEGTTIILRTRLIWEDEACKTENTQQLS